MGNEELPPTAPRPNPEPEFSPEVIARAREIVPNPPTDYTLRFVAESIEANRLLRQARQALEKPVSEITDNERVLREVLRKRKIRPDQITEALQGIPDTFSFYGNYTLTAICEAANALGIALPEGTIDPNATEYQNLAAVVDARVQQTDEVFRAIVAENQGLPGLELAVLKRMEEVIRLHNPPQDQTELSRKISDAPKQERRANNDTFIVPPAAAKILSRVQTSASEATRIIHAQRPHK